ncbi:hypothetical protein NBRC116601_18200 [Cognatishimia sp. WU-CL00825]
MCFGYSRFQSAITLSAEKPWTCIHTDDIMGILDLAQVKVIVRETNLADVMPQGG